MLTEDDDSCSITKINNGFSELTVGLEQNGEQNNHDTLKKFIQKDMFVKALVRNPLYKIVIFADLWGTNFTVFRL